MFCKHCGKQLSDGQAFCDGCGKPAAQTPAAAPIRGGKFSCPHCGSGDLYPITSTETTLSSTGGGFSAGKGCLGYLFLGPLGLLCGSCGSKTKTSMQTTTKNYWMCRSCGKKFLDLEDLNKVIEDTKAKSSRQLIASIVAGMMGAVLSVFVFNMMGTMPEEGKQLFTYLLYILYATIAFAFIAAPLRWKANQKEVQELEAEKAFLEKNAYAGQNAAR